jgi:competence protein ComEA
MFRYIKDYLSFSRSEKNALIVLGLIFILIILLNIFLPFIITPERRLTNIQLSEIKKIQAILNDSSKSFDGGSYKKGAKSGDSYQYIQSDNDIEPQVLYAFDPNNITVEQLRKLNIPEKAIDNIIKYRLKGGRFYKPEDLRKIYGMNEKIYDKLEPYIVINSNNNSINKSFVLNKQNYAAIYIHIEINSATEVDLDKLPLIGPSYAKRIIKYRQMLGGYYKKEQLMEVYGLDSTIYLKIKEKVTIDESKIAKIPLNLADINLMGKHPYLGYKIAKKIIDRRNSSGPFKNILEVKEIIGNELYSRVSPYLKLWD